MSPGARRRASFPRLPRLSRRIAPGIWGVLAAAVLAAGCSNGQGQHVQAKGPPAVPVVVAAVTQKTMPVQVQAVGNVEPYVTVAIKARVDGQIVQAFFEEGQDIAKDAALFQIDPRPFQAQLRQAQANLARDQAQRENAHLQERRNEDLLTKKMVSRDQYDQARTARQTAEANVKADEAAIENARLQLDYSTIRSPIAGRTGRMLIQPGNLVKANDTTPLVVINQIDPIYVSFAVPEQYLDAIRRYTRAGSLRVRAVLPAAATGADRVPVSERSVYGQLAFVDNTVDTSTGTLRLKARFENGQHRLWPGQFVNVVVTLYEQPDAVVVPSQAVQTGPKGQYVFVVGPDRLAQVRPVTVDRTQGEDTVIVKGVTPGEQVVTTGQSRLASGARVSIKEATSGRNSAS